MKRIIRITLAGVAILALLLAVGVGVAVMVVDPNEFKPKIEAAALAATGKNLVLRGDLSFSLFPRLRLEAGPATLEDSPGFGSEPFARLEKLSASVAVLPLFSGKAEIGAVTITGLRLKLVVNEEGNANWVMPTASATGNAPAGPDSGTAAEQGKSSPNLAAVALDSLRVEHALFVYTDMRSRSSMQLDIPLLEITNLKVGQPASLSLEAAYSASMARPVTLSLSAGFTLPPSLALGLVFDAQGKLDGAPLSCKGTLALPETVEGRKFSLNGTLNAGDIDIDKYLAASGGSPSKPSGTTAGTDRTGGENTRNDATLREFLRGMFLDLRFTAKSLTVAKVPVTDVAVTLKADEGLVVAKPVRMTVAEAPLALEASMDAKGNALRTRVTGEWKGAKIGSLLKAATGKASVTGVFSGTWDLNAVGSTWPDAAKSMEGTAGVNVINGVIPGFRLIPAGVPGLPALTLDITDFDASGTWKITRGIAHNNDLAVKAARLAAAGKGQVNIPNQTLSYTVSVELPTLPELPNLTVLPVVISGPLASPSYGIDQPALLRETAKSILNPAAKTGGELQKAGEKLGKLLSR